MIALRVAEVQALAGYIEEHKDEVMAVHRQIEERIAQGNPPEVVALLEQSRRHPALENARRLLAQEANV